MTTIDVTPLREAVESGDPETVAVVAALIAEGFSPTVNNLGDVLVGGGGDDRSSATGYRILASLGVPRRDVESVRARHTRYLTGITPDGIRVTVSTRPLYDAGRGAAETEDPR